MTPERLAEITRFHRALTTRLEDGAPLNNMERAQVLTLMQELIQHAQWTTQETI